MAAGSGEGCCCRTLPVMALPSEEVQVGPAEWVPTCFWVVGSKRAASGPSRVQEKAMGSVSGWLGVCAVQW